MLISMLFCNQVETDNGGESMSVETLKIKNMLLTSANKIISNVENLTKLDCELGDGHHGKDRQSTDDRSRCLE